MKVFHRRKRLAVGVLAASMLASVAGFAPSAHAQPYSIEVEGCDTEDLIEAIEIANAIPDTDRVVLDDKCKYEFERPYLDEDGPGPVDFTENALPVITDDLYIYGNRSRVIGDGDDDNGGFRFMEIDGAAVVEIRDLTIEDFALAVPPADIDESEAIGGAILNIGADLLLLNSTVKDNEITVLSLVGPGNIVVGGGGIASVGGTVTLRNSTVSGNEVTLLNLDDPIDIAAAGGVGVVGDGGDEDGLVLSSSTVKGNKVSAVGLGTDAASVGGGVVVYGGAELTMSRSTVSSNSASAKAQGGDAVAEAGGMYLGESPFVHEITRSTITGNRASAEANGGLAVALGGGIVNTNEEDAGVPGLLVDEDDAPFFADLDNVGSNDSSTISNNKAQCEDVCIAAGGGYANADLVETGLGAAGDAEFNRTVFKGNTADGDDGVGVGGGLAILGDGDDEPEVVLDDATVTKNTAKGDAFARGGGIFTTEVEAVDTDESDIYKNKPDDCWALDVGEFCDFS